MKMRKKDEQNLYKVGAFITGLTAIVLVMIVSIGKENSIFDKKVDVRARVGNVSALKPGSYVELKGIRIGSVTKIDIISEDEVEITMDVLSDQIKWIKQDSKVSISTAGLVGDKYVEIYNGSKSSPEFRPAKDILVSEDLTDLKKIMNKGDNIATITERIMLKLDNILTNLEDGKTIVHAMNSMDRAATNLAQTMSDLNKSNIGSTVNNVNMSMERLNKASGSLERVLARIETGPGSAHSLIYDDRLHEDLRTLLGGAERNKVIKYFIRESIRSSEQKKK